MQKQIIFVVCVLLAAAGCTQDNDSPGEARPQVEASSPATELVADDTGQDTQDHWAVFVKKAEAALGKFNDITVWPDGMPDGGWVPVNGKFIPVTVNDRTPATFRHGMRSDRPMVLPTQIEHSTGGDGQSNPYTVVGRQPGSNPEVQWMFLVRQYSMKEITDPKLAYSPDMAVIGHHPRTGATAYLQYFDDGVEKSSKIVVSPFSDGGKEFWADISKIKAMGCERCHSADPFIHTPWIDQVRVDTVSWEGYPLPMVPSNPLGPFSFVDAGPGDYFEPWNFNLKHLDDPQNACTECHRVSPFSMLGLNSYATRYAGLSLGQELTTPVNSDGWQTDQYHKLPWMPPVVVQDFYAGQKVQDATWDQDYLASAKEINELEVIYSQWMIDATDPKFTPNPKVVPVPRPPTEYESIMVDRPKQDTIASRQSLVVLDSRMRANTDGDLYQWQFIGKGADINNVLAAPMVLRRKPGDGSTIELEVTFVGEARSLDSSGSWVSVNSDQMIQEVRLGDYFGVVLTNTSDTSAPGLIPYTEDEWAKITGADGTTQYPYGYVTYSETSDDVPEAGDTINFDNAPSYRTYSFEFQNKL
jgi:hypothetical protein